MKKMALGIVFFFFIILFFPRSLFAAQRGISSTSTFYFLQTLEENIRLFFTFSKDQKVDYLLDLTEKRVSEMKNNPSAEVGSRYSKHFQDLESVSRQVSDKNTVVQRIEEASLRQQSQLAEVYTKVPDKAKTAILNAQENSSKHVTNTIQDIEGEKKASDYNAKAQAIQKAEQVGKIEQVQMESGPNPSPSEENINQINSGRGLNQLNPINDQNGSPDSGQMQPAAPIQQK